MLQKKWNDGWKFWKQKDSFALRWDTPAHAQEIALPHDAMIREKPYAESPNGHNTGFRDGGEYVYSKTFFLPEEAKDRTWMLRFEGVYMHAMVFVNEQFAGKNTFGYTTLEVPLNDHLRYGKKNEVRVLVRTGNMPNSRWYSGGGIYRDVYLAEGPLTHLVPDGLDIITETADAEAAGLRLSCEAVNRRPDPVSAVLTTVLTAPDGTEAVRETTHYVLMGGERRTLRQRITVEAPALWDDITPALYTCTQTLAVEGGEADTVCERFGIRTLTLDAAHGMRVNGRSVKFRGACIHHDSGILGAATFEDNEYRRISLLKAAGFNAVRMAHHPMSPAMLRACDELGVYVMDELCDVWDRCKSSYDYGLHFRESWQQDVALMVRKDRIHPCVVMYSVGNEIPEIGTPHGAKLCHELCEAIRALDTTRYTLSAINGVFTVGDRIGEIIRDFAGDSIDEKALEGNVNQFMGLMFGRMEDTVRHRVVSERLEMACASTDIAGYNYMSNRYLEDSKKYPSRIMVGSETWPPEIPRSWPVICSLPCVLGDFTWTGWDYIGESGGGVPKYEGERDDKPYHLSFGGDLDITGVRRPVSYFREMVFGLRKTPYIAVQDPCHAHQKFRAGPWSLSDAVAGWTWPGCENGRAVVEVYAPGDEVELFQNGVSLGRKAAGAAGGYRALFETVYTPGELLAVCYENGAELGRSTLCTAGAPAALALTREAGREEELLFVRVQLQDAAGIPVPAKGLPLKATVTGDAVLAAFGTGDPIPGYDYADGCITSFGADALLILRKTAPAGTVRITVEAPFAAAVTELCF
ncbi:MAG: DUF4982 domain-containing protein [Oscillospiraceae bacterium]|nr:DUF4982 domain-containing protein [Oscillospiraceae bacterium]